MIERLIFTLSTGRCGTGYLASVMGTIPGVTSRHEPYPYFTDIMREGRGDHSVYKKWLKDVKLPYIFSQFEGTYIESSHVFIKGFVKPILELGIIPDVIIIRRARRDIALSLLRVSAIPARTPDGIKYCFQPNDFNILLPCTDFSGWTDYQMCYWYVMETEARMSFYSKMIKEYGGLVVDKTLADILYEATFMQMLIELGLPFPDMEKYNLVKNIQVNATEERMHNYWPIGDMMAQEKYLEDLYGNMEAAKSQ